MTDDFRRRVAAILASVPSCGQAGRIVRLGGLTNEVYRVDTDTGVFCVRIPGKGTEEYINRRHEACAARETARVGISPALLHFDAITGETVSSFLAGSTTMSPELFREDAGRLRRAGTALRRLHDSDAVFLNRFELFAMIEDYTAILSSKSASVPGGYAQSLGSALEAERALAEHPARLSPCHCDPLAENFLDTEDRMWIVDWEYSGMNDPLWDLGDLSVEAELRPEDERALFHAYFNRMPTPPEQGRIVIYKAMCDLLWTLWGLIQHANANPADDFWAYSLRRFERCRALMASEAYGDAVRAVAKG